MHRLLRLVAPVLLAGCSAVLIGCGGTFENRSINFSSDGKHVAFQRGDGIYIANKDGKGLTKITPPDKDAIAVGMPEWAPNDQRLIFATARPVGDSHSAVTWPGFGDPANGRFFLRQPARYTCWLRDEPKGDTPPQIHELFSAEVDDVGYIAAGLAVRWHPKGDRVDFVQQVHEGQAVFEYDLAAKTTRRVFPAENTAEAVIFDWTPDGANLVCVLADTAQPEQAGIWIGRDGANWWHVKPSAALAGKKEMGLQRLRAARPTWTKDGQRFAFMTTDAPKSEGAQPRRVLWLGQLDGHRASQILEGYEPIRDLHWHPDGQKLGFIRGSDPGTLQIAQLDGTLTTVAKQPIRTFAGWDNTGAHLAYTTADDKVPNRDEKQYSLLMLPDPLARCAVDRSWRRQGSRQGHRLGTARHLHAMVAVGGQAVAVVHVQPNAPLDLLVLYRQRAASRRPGGNHRRGQRENQLDGDRCPREGADRPLPPAEAQLRRGLGPGTNRPTATSLRRPALRRKRNRSPVSRSAISRYSSITV